jgi:alpha-ribazole phosphatase
MTVFATNELLLIRHAPIAEAGRLCGRTDLPAHLPAAQTEALRALLAPVPVVLCSPARRCTATAEALWPGRAIAPDARLWEQDFGRMDGAALADLPDLGALTPAALADHAYPGGESFADMAARVLPALLAAPEAGPVAVVAHAGTVRAALGHALGCPAAGLAFEVAPLSLTRLRRHAGGWSVIQTNRGA